MQLIIQPLDNWPRPITRERFGPGRFKQDWNNTLRLLEYELGRIDGSSPVLQVDVAQSDIRMDGTMKPNANIRTPRVALGFYSKHGPLRHYCDACVNWRHNVRAIALTLERLRQASMYGAASTGEQYRGFKQLGAGIPMPPPRMTIEAAAGWMGGVSGEPASAILTSKAAYSAAYRALAAMFHPDRNNGRITNEWTRLTQCQEVLDLHHTGATP